uniref:Uncharacterized protein n=1 Tax=Anguilla anguilla TaxID=7936 RepID=A0A0E9Q8Y3_ANGAN
MTVLGQQNQLLICFFLPSVLCTRFPKPTAVTAQSVHCHTNKPPCE